MHAGMDLLRGCGWGAHLPIALARWGAGECYFHDKTEKYNETHNEIHVIVLDDMSYSIMFDIFITTNGFSPLDRAFIMKNYSCILKGRWHTWLRLTQLKYSMSTPLPELAEHPPTTSCRIHPCWHVITCTFSHRIFRGCLRCPHKRN